MKSTVLGLALLAAASVSAHADIRITEVAPYASGNGNTSYRADWFELTNTGSAAVDITGWRVDDDSNSFSSGVALRGISSIAAGQSVVFIESGANGSDADAKQAGFIAAWFNGSAPAGFTTGYYYGSGIGLSAGGDALNVFNAAGVLRASVTFGSSTTGLSFDNTAGLNDTAISQLSTLGIHGAFASFDAKEIGTPGMAAAVPEPESYAMLLAGIGVIGTIVRRRRNAA
jgi:hypothetical protein